MLTRLPPALHRTVLRIGQPVRLRLWGLLRIGRDGAIVALGGAVHRAAILALATGMAGLSRNKAVLAAWLLSALIFGLLHLPTYDWNWVQCVVVIGSGATAATVVPAAFVPSASFAVTANVPAGMLAIGNPARLVSQRLSSSGGSHV